MSKRHIPAQVTHAQMDEFQRLHSDAIRSLGIDPSIVVLNGIERHEYGVMVTVVVPPDDWDGTGLPPSQVDPSEPYKILTERQWVAVTDAEVQA